MLWRPYDTFRYHFQLYLGRMFDFLFHIKNIICFPFKYRIKNSPTSLLVFGFFGGGFFFPMVRLIYLLKVPYSTFLHSVALSFVPANTSNSLSLMIKYSSSLASSFSLLNAIYLKNSRTMALIWELWEQSLILSSTTWSLYNTEQVRLSVYCSLSIKGR